MSEEDRERDETRLCPTCRMPISILAIKCRYCGVEVGRPRKEQETLTVKDLGGEVRTQYTLSGDVMGALEAFRAEELSAQEQERHEKEAAASASWFGRHRVKSGTSDAEFSSDSGLPELDSEHRNLVSITPQAPGSAKARESEPPDHTGYGAAPKLLVAASILIVVFFGAYAAWVLAGGSSQDRNVISRPTVENRALRILEEGGKTLEALDAAAKALRAEDTTRNRDIIQTVRERVVAEVEALLTATPWQRSKLDEASSLATAAVLSDPSETLKQLRQRVSDELDAYGLILVKIDMDSGRVTFRLNNPNYAEKEETAGLNGLIQNRFKVSRISGNSVRLEDTAVPSGRGYRKLIARLLRPVEGE